MLTVAAVFVILGGITVLFAVIIEFVSEMLNHSRRRSDRKRF